MTSNIGSWVGCPFQDSIKAKFGNSAKVAFQGVSASDYSADLSGYIDDGGSPACSSSLARSVEDYAKRCPKAKFVISGWSQGALCAHKSFNSLTSPATRSRVFALTTFGDPISVWQDDMFFPALPANTKLLSYCKTSTPDPLCTNPLEDLPHDPKQFVQRLEAIWRDFSTADLNDAQKQAVKDLISELPKQASKKIGKLGKDILAGHIRRWMLTPQHFLYGVGPNPMTQQAASDIVAAYRAVKA